VPAAGVCRRALDSPRRLRLCLPEPLGELVDLGACRRQRGSGLGDRGPQLAGPVTGVPDRPDDGEGRAEHGDRGDQKREGDHEHPCFRRCGSVRSVEKAFTVKRTVCITKARMAYGIDPVNRLTSMQIRIIWMGESAVTPHLRRG
jgi:hypothetical protein